MEIQWLCCVWMLLITQTELVCCEVEFLQRHAGESVVIPCVLQEKHPAPIGVELKRRWLDPGKVLFQLKNMRPEVHKLSEKDRYSVSGDPGTCSLNVTISQLRASDTDRYFCEFITDDSPMKRIPSMAEFFLYVVASGECGCSSYIILLYAVSSAVALLFILLIALLMLKRDTACPRVKPQPQLAIYEEMVGVHPRNLKKSVGQTGNLHLEEAATNAYSHSFTKSSTENDYAGAFSPAENQK